MIANISQISIFPTMN